MFDTTCEITRDRIDAFVDGDLSDAERNAVRDHCARCAACTRELALALRVRDGLRALPVFTAPARVIDAAGRTISAPRVVPLPVRRSHRRLFPAMAAVLAVVAVAAWFVAERRTNAEPAYSDAEIRRARDEMELAFRYVDHYSAGIIQVDVMQKRVAPRVERALGLRVTSPAPTRS